MIDLLRHGQTEARSGFFGKTNVPLSELGWQQMQQAVVLKSWDQIVSSPLERCLAFAEQLSQTSDTPLTVEANLQEYDFGDWEGLTAAEVMASDSQALGLFWQDPYGFTPPNAEKMADFARRVESAIENLCERFAGQRILVLTHAGVMRLLLAKQQGLPREKLLEVVVEHASLHRLSCDT